jgi:hypothetical protein
MVPSSEPVATRVLSGLKLIASTASVCPFKVAIVAPEAKSTSTTLPIAVANAAVQPSGLAATQLTWPSLSVSGVVLPVSASKITAPRETTRLPPHPKAEPAVVAAAIGPGRASQSFWPA